MESNIDWLSGKLRRAETAPPLSAAKRLARSLAGWDHSDECPVSGHDECREDPKCEEGWDCSWGGLPREECEMRRRSCECGLTRQRELAAEAVDENDQLRAALHKLECGL